jgi:hypothetical protein
LISFYESEESSKVSYLVVSDIPIGILRSVFFIFDAVSSVVLVRCDLRHHDYLNS